MAKYYSTLGKTICVGLDQQQNHITVIKDRRLKVDTLGLKTEITDNMTFILEGLGLGAYSKITPIVAHDFIIMLGLAELIYRIKDDYEYVILDMPPNHSALEMLDAPNVLESTVFKILTVKQRIKRMIKGHDETLERIEYLSKIATNLTEKLDNASFYPLGIPTRLGLLEVKKAIDLLIRKNFKIEKVIINMVENIPKNECNYCYKRYFDSSRWIEKYYTALEKLNLRDVDIVKIPFSLTNKNIDFVVETELCN